MKVRLVVMVCGLALLGMELGGCASTARNTRADEVAAEAMNLEAFPQIVLSNAPRTEVKSVAMGAARSKGWIISRSTEDRLIVQRPLDAEALANLAAGATFKSGTLLEITSYFVEQAGDTKVATRAELVAPAIGDKPPVRTDYTENLQDSLTDSLSSLRESWAENRNRLARATPPAEGFKDAWAKDAPPVESTTIRTPTRTVAPPSPPSTAPVAAADAETESADANENENENAVAEPDMTPVVRPPVRPVSPPASKPNSPPAAVVKPATPPSVMKDSSASAKPVVAAKPAPAKPVTQPAVKPTPKLAATAASPATKTTSKPVTAPAKTTSPAKPVVAAKPAIASTPTKTPEKTTVKTAAKSVPVEKPASPAKPKPVAAKTNNMMELPKAKSGIASSVSFAAQAETYAKQRGCKIGSKGTDLVESRKDGEIHKVPCVGADSVLVKCQKGSCKSLL